MSQNYTSPVSDLLLIGRPMGGDWQDYITDYNFTSEHIPDLKRLYADKQFWEAE